jgi:hypothetical protein
MAPWRAVACCATAAALTAPVLSRHRRHARRDAVGEAWAESVKDEFAHGSRSDVNDDLTAAAKVRDALEALKPELIRAWDDDDAVLVEGINAFDGWFGLKELEAACQNGEVREAGRGVLGAGGAWQMARVGVKDEPITYDDVKGVLDASQTVVLNSLDATCSRVAALSLASIDAFGLPVCTNAYATGAGAATSAPPHTDKQRVLVFQCFGRKHWRVWRPPAPSKRPETDPLARGKGTDVLSFDEFDEEPVLDVTLRPGDVLYVPAGWPHTTDTLDCATDDPSIHLTLGVDTHVWGLDAVTVIDAAGADHQYRGFTNDAPADIYWNRLRKTLPCLGWRADDSSHGAIAEALQAVTTDSTFDAAEASKKTVKHASKTAKTIRDLYADVVFRTTKGATPATRPAPHFARLEKAMDSFLASLGSPIASSSPFSVGDKVKAPMVGVDELFDATVERVAPDGTVDVLFFDGDREFGLDPSSIRKLKKKKKSKVVAKGLGGGAKKKKKVKKMR